MRFVANLLSLRNCVATNKVNKLCEAVNKYNSLHTPQTTNGTKLLNKYSIMVTFEHGKNYLILFEISNNIPLLDLAT